MLRANVPVAKPFGLFCAVRQYPFRFVAERKVNRGRNLVPDDTALLNLLSDRFHRTVRPQKPSTQRLVFAQQSQKQVLGLNIRRAELRSLIATKENHAPGFFGISLKHGQPIDRGEGKCIAGVWARPTEANPPSASGSAREYSPFLRRDSCVLKPSAPSLNLELQQQVRSTPAWGRLPWRPTLYSRPPGR